MLERLDSGLYEDSSFEIKEEPFYLPQGNEVALFEAAYENKLPVMLKRYLQEVVRHDYSYNPGYQSVLKELKQSTRQRFRFA